MKIYLSPERRPAPHGKYWGYDIYEHDVCADIAARMLPLLGSCGFEVVLADPSMVIADRARWANKNGVDYYLAIHTNASTDGTREGTATGTEMLAYQHPEAIRANQCIYDEVTKLYPSKRGLKNGNAYTENNFTQMVSAYIEIGFHDNSSDAAWLLSSRQEIAEAITKGVCAYFGIAFHPPEDKPAPKESITLAELGGRLKAEGITTITL